MRKNLRLYNVGFAGLFGVAAVAFSLGQASAADRIFPLHIKNGTSQPVTFTLSRDWHNCYEGQPGIGSVFGPVAPGGQFTMTLARVQGHGCDGEQGKFALVPSTGHSEEQRFSFSNDGGLGLANKTANYQGWLGIKAADQSYTWTMLDN